VVAADGLSFMRGLVAGLALACGSCTSTAAGGGTDSNTHWLCKTTDDCPHQDPPLECSGGICVSRARESSSGVDAGRTACDSRTSADCGERPVSHDGGADAGIPSCPAAPEPACSLQHGCAPTWRDVGIAQCNGLFLTGSAYRCGHYDALLVAHEDTSEEFFYGPGGRLAGHVEFGSDCGKSCVAYDSSFDLGFVPPGTPLGCSPLLPGCVLEAPPGDCDGGEPPELFDAGPADDCTSCLPGGTLLWGDVTTAAPLSTVSDSSITCRDFHHPFGDGGECVHPVGDCNDIVITQLEDIWTVLESPSVRTALALGARFGSAGTPVFEVKNDFGSFTVSEPCGPSEVLWLAETLPAFEMLMLQNGCRLGQR